MNDFMFIAEKLGMTVFKVDLEHGAMYVVGRQAPGLQVSSGESWTEYLERNREKFVLDGTLEALSLPRLRKLHRQGKEGEKVKLTENTIHILFSGDAQERPYAYILVRRLSESDMMKRVVNIYVFNNCDYFLFLDAGKNSYVTFSSSRSGTPLLPERSDDYEKEVAEYVENFVTEEDREMVIREMSISRILEQLEQHGVHVFYAGVVEPVKGYRRKKVECRYYDRERQKVLLSRTDVTDVWMAETKRQQDYMEILKRASTDPLTGILNMRAFQENVQEAMKQEERAAFLFLDLDNFKNVNDTYGHPTGDKLLKLAAHILREETRKIDYIGRVGGDEFIIYLEGIRQREDAAKIAERICRRIESIEEIEEKKIRISCSIGISIKPEDGADYDRLVDEADRRLYQAKKNGKNGFYIDG